MRRALAAAVMLALLPLSAWAETPATWDLNRVNHYRATHSRAALHTRTALQRRAARWAQWEISHHTLRDDSGGAQACWNLGGNIYGSNVGDGQDVRAVEYAFERSAPHRSNLLDRHYRWVGIAVAQGDGATWVVQEFCG